MKSKVLAAVAAALLASGCASTGGGDPRDPFEPLNRGVYRFNDTVDTYVAAPVARGYRRFVPGELRDRVRNFFSNLADPFIGANNMLQGKVQDGFHDWVRFAFNSSLGLLGLHDIATDMGYEKHNEDFGQTFGRWGSGTGPYLILPILGSSSIRDGMGTLLDFATDPVTYVDPSGARWALGGTRAVQVRSDLLDASRLLDEAALDKYVFQRDAYFQRRRSLVHDGRPPREELR